MSSMEYPKDMLNDIDEGLEKPKPRRLEDMKESLRGVKPDISHVRLDSMVYESRAKEYGSFKYERANYLRSPNTDKECFERFRTYARGAMSHWVKVLDSMEKHQANDPNLEDGEGMRAAMYAPDTEVGADGTPASELPHVCGALASGAMGVCIAVDYGMLPEDPGRPWEKKEEKQGFTSEEEVWFSAPWRTRP